MDSEARGARGSAFISDCRIAPCIAPVMVSETNFNVRMHKLHEIPRSSNLLQKLGKARFLYNYFVKASHNSSTRQSSHLHGSQPLACDTHGFHHASHIAIIVDNFCFVSHGLYFELGS